MIGGESLYVRDGIGSRKLKEFELDIQDWKCPPMLLLDDKNQHRNEHRQPFFNFQF
jgi:hypothetical protein